MLSSLINFTFLLLCFSQSSQLCSSSFHLPKRTPRGEASCACTPCLSHNMVTITGVAWQKAVIFTSFHSQVAGEDSIIAHSKSLHVSQYSNIIFSLRSSICRLNLKSPSVAVGVLYSFFPAFRDQMKYPHTGDNFHVSHIPFCSQSIIFNASLYCLSHQL